MELPREVYNWLCSIGVLTELEIEAKDKSIAILDREATQQFELGLKMPAILAHFSKLNVTPAITP